MPSEPTQAELDRAHDEAVRAFYALTPIEQSERTIRRHWDVMSPLEQAFATLILETSRMLDLSKRSLDDARKHR